MASSNIGYTTWGDGAKGVVGAISLANSLSGPDYAVGQEGQIVTPLTNGNYVVSSPNLLNSAGAVMWCDGTKPTTGTMSATNSFVGTDNSSQNVWQDRVGSGGVTPLANGNYVVSSPIWNGEVGAVTWCDGTELTVETISASNSLVGSYRNGLPLSQQDLVGSGVAASGGTITTLGGVTALKNGDYVVDSPGWYGDAGAVTWGDGTTGISGVVGPANSLVGSYSGDFVGAQGVTALVNGNYLVDSPYWNNSAGAVTSSSGTGGIQGEISDANSLIGNAGGQQVGGGSVQVANSTSVFFGGVTVLPNGNYVVLSPFFAAATWGNGANGTVGSVSSANSLMINSVNLQQGVLRVDVLPNGNYFVNSVPGGTPGYHVTWVDGTNGTTWDAQNAPDPQNSFYGYGPGITSLAPDGGAFLVNSGYSAGDSTYLQTVVTDPNDLTYAFQQGKTITVSPDLLARALDDGENVSIQANDDITIDSPITESPSSNAGSLTLDAGRSILINASINTGGGNLSLVANDSVADGVINSERDPGAANITMTAGATLNTGSGSLFIDLVQSTDKTNNDRGAVTLLGVDTDAFVFPSGSEVGVSIKGSTPGDGIASGTYSQIDVSGSIDLNNATLKMTTSAAISAGETFVIVQSGGGVSGTFKGLFEGALVAAVDGSEFAISYQADAGDAVVLTALSTTPALPVVTVVSPATGPTTGGTSVTITGTNLAGATAVAFGSTLVTSFISDSPTAIVVSSPAGTGTVDVTVETPAGTSADSSVDQFSYFVSQAVPTSLSATCGSGAFGGTATLMAALTAGALPLAGRTVTFTLEERGTVTNLGTATTDGNGIARMTGVSLGGLAAGTYPIAVHAAFAGDSNYAGSDATGALVVVAATQAVFTTVSEVAGAGNSGATATLMATLTAGALPLTARTVTFTLEEHGTFTNLGTATTDGNGIARMTGVSLGGLAAGTYPIAVHAVFAGDSNYAGSNATGPLVVTAASPLLIVGERPLFLRKVNKKGKPIGKPILNGFDFDFSGPLNSANATNMRYYQIDAVTTKRVKKQTQRILHPITKFSISYSATNDSITLRFAPKQTFKTGGQITVVGVPSGGVTGASGASLSGNKVFTVSPGGKRISPD